MRGLTLVEILVAILIFSIIMIAIGLTVVAGKNSLFTSDTPTQLRQNILFSIMTMSRELRQTSPSRTNLAEGASANSITFQVPFDNNADGIVVDSVGNIEWGSNITYSLDGSNQLIRTQSGVSSVIAPNIVVLQFSRQAGENRIIQIDITAQNISSAGNWQDQEQAILKMRN
ncbi:MAG: prepilin-type N-terminal cleavage/methylation domain-containing protein [Candidatus Omnitrophica bacterium]|nr:prepilin-type N-terminal cleavage/methylation domain-containing protein [Candidatus Omnitrophota bacterium]MDD5660926.1 prepilin-type N-terminal cleavage/methylation domain-containing protein [Candidatus Omnitrophota bacterium]